MARILVVDDVKFISQMLAEILRKEGHEVETAGDGQMPRGTKRRSVPHHF